MKRANDPQKDRDTARRLRDPKVYARQAPDLNTKNHKNPPVNMHRQQDDKDKDKGLAELELERLRAQVEERDKEIAALRQAAKMKDRKLDQLNNRCRKEQLRQYYRFMELEPVVELEEDSGGGEDSPTSSGPPSLSPPPYVADIWAEDSLYSSLLREHVELQRSHHALELRLKRSEARARQLQELRRTTSEQLQQLQAEALELRELNELLEFRILELEEGQDSLSMARSPGPDTRDVCTDTENDDVSDSGVVSLPNSEEVGSDTDLGVHDLKIDLPHEELRERILLLARSSSCSEDKCCVQQVVSLLEDYSPLQSPDILLGRSFKNLSDCTVTTPELAKTTRIVATVLPFNEMAHLTEPFKGKPTYMKTKSTDSLQESGIFETDVVSKSTQTEGPAVSGDLSAEIQKLTQFRERIEEERAGLLAGSELAFYRERLRLMEDKVQMYESSGVAQAKELAAKITRLQAENSRLEEERCELEEAENDTRLRCQKLEAKLQALCERNTDLQTQLQVERRAHNSLKADFVENEAWESEVRNLEAALGKYEQRNYELEEREMELSHRLELLEEYWPIMFLWIIWRTVCTFRKPYHAIQYCYQDITSKLQELDYEDTIGERQEAEGMSNTSDSEYRFELQERHLGDITETDRIKKIEENYQKKIRELQESYKQQKQTSEISCQTEEDCLLVKCVPARAVEVQCKNSRCVNRVHELLQAQVELKARVAELQRKEAEDFLNTRDKECRFEEQETERIKETEESYLKKIAELQEILQKQKETSEISCQTEDECFLVKCVPARTVDEDCETSSRLQELLQAQAELKTRILELQQKEAAYMETLQRADDLWSELEIDYQKQIQELKVSETDLQSRVEAADNKYRLTCQNHDARVSELENSLSELQAILQKKEDEKIILSNKLNSVTELLAATESGLGKLQKEVDEVLKPQLVQEQRLVADLQKDLEHKSKSMESLHDSYDTEIEILKCQLSAVQKEYMHANCECDQLKAEVLTLEKTILDQRECLLEQKEHNEKTFITLTTLLEAKDRELEIALLAVRDATVRSAHDEIEEALKSQEQPVQSTRPAVRDASVETEEAPPVPIQPPPRTKRGATLRRASLQEGQDKQQVSQIMDAASNHAKECSRCSGPIGAAVKTIQSQVQTLRELIYKDHNQQSSPAQRRSQSIPNQSLISLEGPSTVKQTEVPRDKPISKNEEEPKKRTWLTEVSINISDPPRPIPADVKSSIMYWDDLTSHNSTLTSTKINTRTNRTRVLCMNEMDSSTI